MDKIFFKILMFLAVSFCFTDGYSQKINLVGLKFSQGFITPHHQEIRVLSKGYVQEFNFQIGIETDGQKYWQKVRNYPEIGFGLYYANLQNPQILGNSFASYIYYDKNLFAFGKFKFNSYVAIGAAFLKNHFNARTNYLNFVNGSLVNIFANVNFELSFSTEKIIFYSDLGLTHYSNGGSRMPNLGLNILAPSFGIKYRFRENKKTSNSKPQNIKKYDFCVLQSYTKHDDDFSVSDKLQTAIVTSFDAGYYKSAKTRFGVGIDVMYDDVAKKYLIADGVQNVSNFDCMSFGLHIGYSAVFSNVHFTFQSIFFVRKKFTSPFYQRYGFRYYAGKHFVAGLTLVTNFFNAQFIEPSVGLRF